MTPIDSFFKDLEFEYISAEPFDDYAIKEYIAKNGCQEICDWTREVAKCIPMSDLIEFIDKRIKTEYVEPYEAGGVYDKEETFYEDRFPDLFVQSSQEIIYEQLSDTPAEILTFISERLSHEFWTRKEMYVPTNGEVQAKSWEDFSYIIKHKVRFMFFSENFASRVPSYEDYSDPYSVIEQIREAINTHNLISEFEIGQIEIHRARMHRYQLKQLKVDELGPPPERLAQANRLSPAGISMFYGAFEKETAIIEIVDMNKPDSFVTVGQFTNLKPIKLIDFTKLQWISLFDTENELKRKTYVLLYRFIMDLKAPISNDGSQHIDYIPTQIVTEYLKNSYTTENNEEIHGLIYPSSKRKNYKNVVLFFNKNQITDNKDETDKYLLLQSYQIRKFQINELNFSISIED